MAPVGSRIRAFFACVNRDADEVTVFDPAKHGVFPLDSAPAPWIDLGWIENFRRTSTSTIETVFGGNQGSTTTQFRTRVGATVELDFCDWGKLQMALSSGTQHMNVLATAADAAAEPCGGTPVPAIAVLPGSTAQEVILGTGAVSSFAPGDLIAVDLDYQQQVGYVGTGIAGAYVKSPDDVARDVNYVRRVTFNVGRVKETTATSLVLWQPMPGGAPGPLSGAQKVVAFLDREGGNFFQEWSALFVAGQESGGRICYYYPRLRPRGNSEKVANMSNRESTKVFAEPLSKIALHASFDALAKTDHLDGEPAVCYRSYFPAGCAPVY